MFVFIIVAGLKNLFIKSFKDIASVLPTRLLLELSGQKLILPFYHTVSDLELPHIKHLYPVKDLKSFKQDLEFLLKRYDPISYSDLQESVIKDEPFSKPSFLLSFDDGLKEVYDVIAPVLWEKGIPAIFFLNSDFIDNKDLFYRYKVSLLIDQMSGNKSLVRDESVQNWLKKYFPEEQNLMKALLSISYRQKSLADELAAVTGLSFESFLREKTPYLSSNQILSLKEKGFHFGGHSIDHPEYRHIDFEEQIRQTSESVKNVSEAYHLSYKCFSFPFTDFQVSNRFFNTVYDRNIAYITFGSAGIKKELFKRHFQRIPLEVERLSARKIIHSELLYFCLKAPFRRNLIKRL